MIRTLTFALATSLLAVVLAAATMARAEPPGSLAGIKAYRGAFLSGGFTSTTGSVGTSVQVFAGNQLLTFDDPIPYKLGILLFISQGTLNGGETMSAQCEGTADRWRVGPNLSDASVRGTAACFDYITNSSFNVSVDLTAGATGALERFTQESHFFESDLIFLNQASGAARTADVYGTVLDGVQNFTPNTSNFGAIARTSEGVIVVRPPGLAH